MCQTFLFRSFEHVKITVFNVGDILELKKNHPCGQNRFRVLRTGTDVRLVCLGCGRDMTVYREKIDRMIAKVTPGEQSGKQKNTQE